VWLRESIDVAADRGCFSINVNVYNLRDDGVALTVYESRCHHDDTMHVNQFDHHLSYISNLPAYTQKYQCGTCDRHFARRAP
jgi:hypothetical protein